MKRVLPASALAAAVIIVCGSATTFAAPGPMSEVEVDVNEEDQPVADVLRRLQERHGLNYVVSEQVLARAGKVTVKLKQVPLDTALQAICAGVGLTCELNGPVIVILPRDPAAPPRLPAVEQGVVPDSRPQPVDPTVDAAPRRTAFDDEPLPAIGTLEEVDMENRRVQLRIDGVKRDFYLPTTGPGMQVTNLERAVPGLKPGTRMALTYRRDASGRSVICDLIGDARRQPRRERSRPATAHRDEAPSSVAPVVTEQPTARASGAPDPAAASAPALPPAPEVPPAAEAPAAGPMTESFLSGKLVAREGEVVRIRRADGEVFELRLPLPENGSDRRERVEAAVDTLRPMDQILVTYEDRDGVRYIRDTITGRTR